MADEDEDQNQDQEETNVAEEHVEEPNLIPTESAVLENASPLKLMQNECEKVLEKVEEIPELEYFKNHYRRLFEQYVKTYKDEHIIEAEVEDLDKIIADQEEELTLFKTTREKQVEVIGNLTEELEYSNNLEELAKARESECQAIIESMRSQIVKLNAELDQTKGKQAIEDTGDTDDQAKKDEENFEREQTRLLDEIVGIKQKLNNAVSYSEELEKNNAIASAEHVILLDNLEVRSSENTKKTRTLEQNEDILAELTREKENLKNLIKSKTESIQSYNKYIKKLETSIKFEKLQVDKQTKYAEFNEMKFEKCSEDYEKTGKYLVTLQDKIVFTTKSQKQKNDECIQLKNETARIIKQCNHLEKKIGTLDITRLTIETERDKIDFNIHLVEKEIHNFKKQSEYDKEVISSLQKDKVNLENASVRIQYTIDQHVKLIKIQEETRIKMEAAVTKIIKDITILRRAYKSMEIERNRAMEEILELSRKIEDSIIELRMKDAEIHEILKSMNELDAKLTETQVNFEAVRAERNDYQQQLHVVISELEDVKYKIEISVQQCGQLKEDISDRDVLLLKSDNMMKKLVKDKENLKSEIQLHILTIDKYNFEITELARNERSLQKCVAELKIKIEKLKSATDKTRGDRDVIGTQLVRRNDEIGLLHEKLKILQITFARGEGQYDQRIDDIRILKIEIKRLRVEVDYLGTAIINMVDFKHEIFTLEKDLSNEKLKVRALEEELTHPMNVQRWRKLEGSDPKMLALLGKIDFLQRRLLKQSSESLNREKQLRETERLYYDLCQVCLLQPGPEIKNELVNTQKALVARSTKIKRLISETNMNERLRTEYREQMKNLKKEIQTVDKDYQKQKEITDQFKANYIKLPVIQNSSDLLPPLTDSDSFELI